MSAVAEHRCPCGYVADCADTAPGTSTPVDAKPSPGDLTVCIRCGRVLQFTEAMGVRPFEAMGQLAESERAAIRRVQAAIHSMRGIPS